MKAWPHSTLSHRQASLWRLPQRRPRLRPCSLRLPKRSLRPLPKRSLRRLPKRSLRRLPKRSLRRLPKRSLRRLPKCRLRLSKRRPWLLPRHRTWCKSPLNLESKKCRQGQRKNRRRRQHLYHRRQTLSAQGRHCQGRHWHHRRKNYIIIINGQGLLQDPSSLNTYPP